MRPLKRRQKPDHGSITILAIVWLTLMLAGLYAATALGSGLTTRVILMGAMTNAAQTLEQSMQFTGPSRESSQQFALLVQRDLGPNLSFTVSNFDVRAGGRWGWTVSASGYVVVTSSVFGGASTDTVISDRVGT